MTRVDRNRASAADSVRLTCGMSSGNLSTERLKGSVLLAGCWFERSCQLGLIGAKGAPRRFSRMGLQCCPTRWCMSMRCLVDDVSRTKTASSFCGGDYSTRDLSVASVFLQKRSANGAAVLGGYSVSRGGRFSFKSWARESCTGKNLDPGSKKPGGGPPNASVG